MLNFEMQYTTTYYFSNFGNLSSALGIRHVFFIKLSHDHEPYILMHAKFVSGVMYLLFCVQLILPKAEGIKKKLCIYTTAFVVCIFFSARRGT